jgi:nucleoside-diphosphate-sugar epimerase
VRDASVVEPLVGQADVLIPLAAVVGAPACDRDPAGAQSVNLDAVRLLNRARTPGQLLVFPATNSGYGTRTGDTMCDEDTPLEPVSVYGRTKVQAESEVLQTPNVIALRLATVFGMSSRMRLDLLVNDFVHTAITAGSLVIFEKDFARNFVHVRDVADCVLHCLDHAAAMAGRPYNVGLDSANMSKEALALKIKAHIPQLSIHFADIGRDPDRRNYLVCHDRLRAAGFEPRRTLDEGIRELITGFRMMPRSPYENG